MLTKSILPLLLSLSIIGVSIAVNAADTNTTITKENVDDEFSYQKINEQAVRNKAQEILDSNILVEAAEKHRGTRMVYEALLSRILDNWRYVSTMISWFKNSFMSFPEDCGQLGFSRHADWNPWSLEDHFTFSPIDEENVRLYGNRHNVVQHPHMTKKEAESYLQSYKDFFAEQESIQYLHDLQIEGLALNLIYKGIKEQKPDTMKIDNPEFFSGIDLEKVKFDFIPIYVVWSQYPNSANLKIPH